MLQDNHRKEQVDTIKALQIVPRPQVMELDVCRPPSGQDGSFRSQRLYDALLFVGKSGRLSHQMASNVISQSEGEQPMYSNLMKLLFHEILT